MNRKLLVLSLFCILVFGYLIWSQKGSSSIISPTTKNSPTSTPIPTATPTPIILNSSSNLGAEADKLDPESFNEDFKQLLNEANNF